MRRLVPVCMIVFGLLLTACGDSSNKSAATVTVTKTIEVPVAPPASAISIDKQDPNKAGCSTPSTETIGSVTVKLPNGRKYGTLHLRRSTIPSCRSIWGLVDHITKAHVLLKLNAVRKSKVAAYKTRQATATAYAYGSMLSYVPGCVYATARADGGPIARTQCVGEK